MDLDHLLGEAHLPEVPVDTEAALARTARRWRARRQRRLAAAGVAVVLVIVGVAFAVTRDRGDRPVDVHTGTTPDPRTSSSWRRMGPSPLSPRMYGVAAWTGEEMIVVGGSTDEPCAPGTYCTDRFGAQADGAAYDPDTDSWRRIADAPGPLVDGSAAWTGSRLLVAARFETPGVVETDLYSYDPEADRWATIDPPEGVAADALGYPAWTGYYWVFPLFASGSDGTLWGYDPARDEWSWSPRDNIGPARSRQLVWTGEDLVVIAEVDGFGEDPEQPGYLAAVLDPDGGHRERRLPTPHVDASGGGTWIAVGDRVVDPYVGAWDLAAGTWQAGQLSSDVDHRGGRTGFSGFVGGWVVVDSVLHDPDGGGARTVEARPGGGVPAVSVWTGEEILTWGGGTPGDDPTLLATGAAYRLPPTTADAGPRPTTTTASTEPHACDAAAGSPHDVAGESPSATAGHRRWTDDTGCLVRIDVVADRQGPERCGLGDIRLITLGPGFSRNITGSDEPMTYARDPDGIVPRREVTEPFSADTELPSAVLNPGLRHGDTDLFLVIGYPWVLYVRAGDHVERWPSVEPPVCR